MLIGEINGFNIFLDDDELYVGTYASHVGIWVTQTMVTNTAYHVAMAFDGSAKTVTGYLNGTSFGSSATSFNSVSTHTGDIAIGAFHIATRYPSDGNLGRGDHFDGIIDDVALYDSVLSPTRIQLHAAGCSISLTTTIVEDIPDPSMVGQTVTVTFSVTATLPGNGTPSGNVTVTISDGSENCVSILSAGAGQCQKTLIIAGNRTLTATYGGDANFASSGDTEPHTVSEAKVFLYLPLVLQP